MCTLELEILKIYAVCYFLPWARRQSIVLQEMWTAGKICLSDFRNPLDLATSEIHLSQSVKACDQISDWLTISLLITLSQLYLVVLFLSGFEKHLRIAHKWCIVYTLILMLGVWQGLTCTVAIPWSLVSLMCWAISKDDKDSFPNKSCRRKYCFVACPFALPPVKGRTEAPILHWLDTEPAWHSCQFWHPPLKRVLSLILPFVQPEVFFCFS